VRWFRREAGGHAEPFSRHLDEWAGPGERVTWPSREGGITVVRLEGRPHDGLATLITFGLSHESLVGPDGRVLEELIVTVLEAQADDALAGRLTDEALLIRDRGIAPEPGDIRPIGDGIGSRGRIRSFWITAVHGFAPGFDLVAGADLPIRLVQLVPLTVGEYDHAMAVGGHQFGHDVDPRWDALVDLDRDSLYAPVGVPGGYHWAGLEDLDATRPRDRVAASEIALIRPGDVAKLRFSIEPVGTPGPVVEQMWVVVDSVDGDRLSGRLATEPTYLVELVEGTIIPFERRHVLDVRRPGR
jgi:hypothetical protein